MKKKFTRENLMLLLLIGLFGHNIYLQFEIDDTKSAARSAWSTAQTASDYALRAANYASYAADYAEEASEHASGAESAATNAYYAAQDAADNAFGNQCWSCP
jgi:cytoskeletal protein RodZ